MRVSIKNRTVESNRLGVALFDFDRAVKIRITSQSNSYSFFELVDIFDQVLNVTVSGVLFKHYCSYVFKHFSNKL